MEPSNQSDKTDQKDDCFFDGLEDFPFHDCAVADQSDQSTSDSTLCESSLEVSYPITTLRRRLSSGHGICNGSKDFNTESFCINSDITQTYDSKTKYKEKRHRFFRDLNERERNLDFSESTRWIPDRVDSVEVTSKVCDDDKKVKSIVNDDRLIDSVEMVDELGDSASGNLLEFIAGLVIKAIVFQVSLFVKFITFPIWTLHFSYMFVIDPVGAMRRGRGFIVKNLIGLLNLISGFLSPLITGWLKEHMLIWKLLVRFGWGMIWSFYVCIILCGLLVFSMMVSGSLIRNLVENPVQMKEELNFDYTQNSPVAFVPIMSCRGVGCSVNCEEKSLGPRVIPPNHKLEVNVLLTLPESGYNRNLGIFQVRVDFLSGDGKTLSSKRQLCMLKFRSEPIRFLLTFFKLAPLVTGYMLESQILKVKFRGFKEGDVPTSCLKVIIEQRAEFRLAGGIPEIYDASLILESELPVVKWIIWSWKKTMFVWITMMLFIIELLFTLICCRPVIIPRTRPRDVPAVNNSTPKNLSELGSGQGFHVSDGNAESKD
ncbi:hypothetical protein P3X46_020150 [Hevea brasiliensis]|uniref:Seipin-2-like n=1 Tax=Hevea brasiliensis TaxID=3981 RepID=A0ABQ9LN37_HEVBR|nr:seipin-2 [Hevea brasiliensis]XP_021669955.2 seipin-2 [Hevea brasiliensis]XP_021669956.2 seipin-2 [Hevea brasiliensis]KAJ9168650.1 hypothetical protein P3X46_020150 [Hevea brasiliensis]KAJ9168651.1 hypothetical protein P3X46_020150 [Hevea brasiliensis]KAJ9168652.1 hypothetical protein P3X46_020150 [Hevea brasiliensis]